MRLVLASASPRRVDLLRAAGFAFDVQPAAVDESVRPGETADAYVRRLALQKALAVEVPPQDVVLGADTAVVVDGTVLGKPEGADDASRMLRLLSGRSHEVLTGVAVKQGSRSASAVERTEVRFAALSEGEIAWYVQSGEPVDKAGAYGIQGLASRFVERIDGSYTNVVGLPVPTVYRLLLELLGPGTTMFM